DAVKDDNLIVDRVPNQGEERAHHRQGNLLLRQGKQPEGNDDIVKESGNCGNTVDRFEAEPDIEEHRHHRQPYRERCATSEIGPDHCTHALHSLDGERSREKRLLETFDRGLAYSTYLCQFVQGWHQSVTHVVSMIDHRNGQVSVERLYFGGCLVLTLQVVRIG